MTHPAPSIAETVVVEFFAQKRTAELRDEHLASMSVYTLTQLYRAQAQEVLDVVRELGYTITKD